MADFLPKTTPASARYSRFVVQSNDVLQDESRITVKKEGSEEVIWFKERYLGEKEIIEHVVHNATRTICWIVHRPLRGWYIRLRAPNFPPGVFIPLNPVPSRSPHYTEAALSFHSRTNLPCPSDDSIPTHTYFASPRPPPTRSSSSIHSYPPTPPPAPTLVLQPPSPTSEATPLPATSTTTSDPKRKINITKPSISEFVLAPYADPVPSKSLFARVLNSFRDYDKMNYNSFTLSRIAIQSPPPYSPVVESPVSGSELGSASGLASASQVPLTTATSTSTLTGPTTTTNHHPNDPPKLTSIACLPLLTFHDQTSTLTFRSLTGLLEIDQAEEQMLGIDTSFWVTVALTYLDFLSDRGSYLAVLGD